MSRHAATVYIVCATASYPTEARATRKDGAVREAEMRAKADPTERITVTTEKGKEVYAIEPVAPARKTPKGPRIIRTALNTVTISDTEYDVLYTHPRQHTETLRTLTDGKPTYYIRCTEHDHIHQLSRLIDDRKCRRAGRHTWCTTCDEEKQAAATAPTE